MLDRDTRAAIFRLAREGHGSRAIARALGISRRVVKKVMRSGEVEVPAFDRAEQRSAHLERIRELHGECKGNQVRVWEKLTAETGVEVAYSTPTARPKWSGRSTTSKTTSTPDGSSTRSRA